MIVLTIVTWVLSGLLALVNLMAGGMKVLKPHGGDKPMPTLADFSDTQVRLIGIAEVLGAIGLIVPALTGVLPWLTPLAALGIAIIQFLAIFAHRRHSEPFVPNIVMMLIALVIIVLRLVGA
ncbi:DoxX family protein [Microbacterium sp. NPDC057659]|uniref:DoxX family protein n=1 Tax=Microbacterium sp. NPDC057659 TaxID=3346198 RepID=UPI00366C8A3F